MFGSLISQVGENACVLIAETSHAMELLLQRKSPGVSFADTCSSKLRVHKPI